jgi:hypothetical protein
VTGVIFYSQPSPAISSRIKPLWYKAVFVEGQGEQIFVRHLLNYLLEPDKFSFECLCLRAENLERVPYSHKNEYAEVHFLIINTQGDGSVLPAIKKREKGLFSQDYHKIIGLRDMYSQAYCEISPGVIDNSIMQQFPRRVFGRSLGSRKYLNILLLQDAERPGMRSHAPRGNEKKL